MKHFILIPLITLGALTFPACTTTYNSNTEMAGSMAASLDVTAINAALAAQPGRSDAEKARDAQRKPAEVLAFLGAEPGDTVLDALASGGWYTEAMSIALGSDATIYAQNTPGNLKRRDGANDKAMTARLADDRLSNVVRLDEEFAELSIPDGSLDLAITALNFHDVYFIAGEEQTVGLMKTIKSKLKPGGVFGIIDHVGNAGADNEKLHRIDPALVVKTAEAAGFIVEEQGDMLANSEDDHSANPFGLLRGKTDRFVLRLRNP